ncbi:uncharacterized protein [Lolium perenne]|uniref:uncharacterized protein n=1 Tax=Lolium perenne TaxID=4522 RepID=UPI003A999FD7
MAAGTAYIFKVMKHHRSIHPRTYPLIVLSRPHAILKITTIGRTPPEVMEATASDKKEAQPASDGAPTARVPSEPTILADASSAAVESGCGVGEDEQVERFYALLANIRALRDVYGAAGSSRKRTRVAEPAWRPKFRMEDFREEADDAASGKKGRRDHVEGQRPENDDEWEVVEENDRVHARVY